MKTLLATALGALVLLAGATPAAAEAIEEKNLLKGKATIEPDMGYIYLTGPTRMAGKFLRVQDADDIAAYRAELEEATAKAKAKFDKRLARWEDDAQRAAKQGVAAPEKPVFEQPQIGDLQLRGAVDFGPMYVFAKTEGDEGYSYLSAAKPGWYIWYGTVVLDTNRGWQGQCLCMGTVRFEVKPGMVTDLGNALSALPDFAHQEVAPAMDVVVSGAFSGTKVERPEGDLEASYGLPASLASYPSARAELHAQGKLNNFYGVMITRLPKIDGVLAYERDTIIDERTGAKVKTAILPQ